MILIENFQNDIWELDDLLKVLKREAEVKKRSFSIGLHLNLNRKNMVETIQHQLF